MASDINAEHSFFSIALHVHPEVVFKGCARVGGIESIQRALELDEFELSLNAFYTSSLSRTLALTLSEI